MKVLSFILIGAVVFLSITALILLIVKKATDKKKNDTSNK